METIPQSNGRVRRAIPSLRLHTSRLLARLGGAALRLGGAVLRLSITIRPFVPESCPDGTHRWVHAFASWATGKPRYECSRCEDVCAAVVCSACDAELPSDLATVANRYEGVARLWVCEACRVALMTAPLEGEAAQ